MSNNGPMNSCAIGMGAGTSYGTLSGATNPHLTAGILNGGDYDTGYVLAANLGGSNSNPSHFVAQTIKTHKGSFKRVGNCVRT